GGSVVTGLDPNGDNFLAVRSGPGTEYRKIDELHTGDQVRTCDLRGNWVGVYYGAGGNRKSGWVFRRYLADGAG
ncbi:MAG: SH3 domain-containing protein, partial [Gemmobacter sp.]